MTPFNKRRGEGTLSFEKIDGFRLELKGTWKDDIFEKGEMKIENED